jgi:hypothetical protein
MKELNSYQYYILMTMPYTLDDDFKHQLENSERKHMNKYNPMYLGVGQKKKRVVRNGCKVHGKKA